MWLLLSLEVVTVVAKEKMAVQNVEVEEEAVEVALVLLWNAERRMQEVVVGVEEEVVEEEGVVAVEDIVAEGGEEEVAEVVEEVG